MAEIIWAKKARSDLKTIHHYISLDSQFYADRFILKLLSVIDVLEHFPRSGRIVPEKNDPLIRELIEGNYRIFYKLHKPGIVYILRIHNAARKIK